MSFAATRSFLKHSHRINSVTIRIKSTISVNSRRNVINVNPALLPIIIFGGSPISVAVPPMLEARISVIRYGIGFMSRYFATRNVIGTTRITVVTLAKNAEATAVKNPSTRRIFTGWPFVFFNNSLAIHVKIPLLLAMLTIIIIETSKNITLKSTKFIK